MSSVTLRCPKCGFAFDAETGDSGGLEFVIPDHHMGGPPKLSSAGSVYGTGTVAMRVRKVCSYSGALARLL